jgi:hypothetical protein
VNLCPQSPTIAAAAQALYGGPGEKKRIQREQGDNQELAMIRINAAKEKRRKIKEPFA